MVALATPRFDYIVEPNLARTFLHRALLAQEAGKLFEAGVLLREAVRRQLYAECSWKNCLPAEKVKHNSPRLLLKALIDAGHIDQGDCKLTREIIDIGNRAAHCGRVTASEIRFAISLWHCEIDSEPCGEDSARVDHCKPADKCGDDWDDDDDRGDDWKAGAV